MNKKAYITNEVQAYLINTNNNNDLSHLEWWRENGGKYLNVARVSESGWQFRIIHSKRARIIDVWVIR